MFGILKQYFEKRIDLMKLDFAEKSSLVSGFIFFLVISLLFILLFITFLILGLAFWLGHKLGNHSYGLFITSGFCLVCFLMIYFFRKNIQTYASEAFFKLLNK
ncbi:MAG: hypothetical protein FDW93_02150 [Bergeyella sp.]|nr:hypothetical protein [Bergeyella sp.]